MGEIKKFSKEFNLKNYTILLTSSSIGYKFGGDNDGDIIPILSEFRNKFDEENNEIIIENVFMTLRCNTLFQQDIENMFDFILRGFKVHTYKVFIDKKYKQNYE